MLRLLITAAALLCTLAQGANASAASAAPASAPVDFRARPASDEIIYFLLTDRFENSDPSNDRGGLKGDRLHTGYDPTAKGYFHGGDLKGVSARLDYIQSLGATALWLAPVFVNQPVQGPPGDESAGYHGYWITDFTKVDPHLGNATDLHALVEAAHAHGMKVYFDIVINHTADVIRYRECPDNACPYRSRADFPDRAEGYAYTPYLPRGAEHVKVPEWLNDPAYYHNRGNSTFEGESAMLGDFSGLDDLATENPRVVQGFIDLYGKWIDDYGIDGYRIDTAKHVNPEFWQAFVPAMLARAAARGIANFHIFGEVYSSDMDPAALAVHTRVDKLPAVLDFAFSAAVRDTVAGRAGTEELARLFAADPLYEGGAQAALQLPTFVSNHDGGRFAYFVHKERPSADAQEVTQRVQLAFAMLLTLRGVPTLYYGDEQGFAGLGGDQDSRQDMFASHFDRTHPLYKSIAALAHLRQQQPALRHGAQIVRAASRQPGLFAVSRLDAASGQEILLAFNTGTTPINAQVVVEPSSNQFTALHGQCAAARTQPGSYTVSVPPLDFLICSSETHP